MEHTFLRYPLSVMVLLYRECLVYDNLIPEYFIKTCSLLQSKGVLRTHPLVQSPFSHCCRYLGTNFSNIDK